MISKWNVMSKRRKFSDEFKCEAVGLTRQAGAHVSQIARDIDVGAAGLGLGGTKWRRHRRNFPCFGCAV